MRINRWHQEILARLSRQTSTGRFIPEIDGLRFFAIGAVLLFHAGQYFQVKTSLESSGSGLDVLLQNFIGQGYVGVQLFFVISGFILAVPFAEHYRYNSDRPQLTQYYLRRVTRLEPPYILNLLLFTLLYTLMGMADFSVIPHLLASMFYVHNIAYGEGSTINAVAWSLEVEIQFYLLVPWLTKVFGISHAVSRRALLAILIGMFAVMCDFLPMDKPLHGLTLAHQLHYFLAGFFLADLYLSGWCDRRKRSLWWDVPTTAAWVGIVVVMYCDFYFNQLLAPLMLLAYVGVFRGVIWNRITRNQWLVTIGGMCYTIYLFHGMIKSAVGRFTIRFTFTEIYWVNLVMQLLILSVIIIAVCAVLFAVIERPFMHRDWPGRVRAAVGTLRQRFNRQ